MTLHLLRHPSSDGATIGRLSIDGVFECYTCEDVIRDGPKVAGQTAIPAGTYRVAITFSQRFQRDMPQLLDVPGFSGVRIHPGNTAADTRGCILVGQTHGAASVHQSRLAYGEMFDALRAANDPISITIENPAAEPQAA